MVSANIGNSFTDDFEDVPLLFEDHIQVNVFASKNNKSVEQTLAHPRYAKFSESIVATYGAPVYAISDAQRIRIITEWSKK